MWCSQLFEYNTHGGEPSKLLTDFIKRQVVHHGLPNVVIKPDLYNPGIFSSIFYLCNCVTIVSLSGYIWKNVILAILLCTIASGNFYHVFMFLKLISSLKLKKNHFPPRTVSEGFNPLAMSKFGNMGLSFGIIAQTSPSLSGHLCSRSHGTEIMGLWDGWAREGSCHQGWWPELDFQSLHGGRREPTPAGSLQPPRMWYDTSSHYPPTPRAHGIRLGLSHVTC